MFCQSAIRNPQSAIGVGLLLSTLIFLAPALLHAQTGAVESFIRDSERQTGRRTPSALRGLIPGLFDPEAMKQDLVDLRLITPPLEQAIDPETYIVGPGDNLLVSVADLLPGYALTVTPEGLLVIPTVGELSVNGLTLAEVKRQVETRARPRYRTGEISTILLYPRQFRITVSGAVNSPGQIVATPVDRVSEVLYLANRLTDVHNRLAASDPGYVLPSARASDRNIEIRRTDGATVRVDLRRYLATGRLADNPYLMDGDIVYVPVRNVEGGTVALSGAVSLPGVYEYAEGDRLGTILDLAGGLTDSADRTRVEISRLHPEPDGSARTETVSADLTRGPAALDIPVRPRDRIFVRTAAGTYASHAVTVKGEVRYPGPYPIQPDGLPLSRLIDLAGGFTEDAFLAGAKVLRPLNPAENPDLERLARLRMSRIGSQEIADFETQIGFRQQAVVADFPRLFEQQDEKADVVLRHGDVVVVPSKNETVHVMGQVAHPGQIPYEPGRDLNYYIEEAGGFGNHARRSHIQIIKAETNAWLSPDQTPIEIGDMIWVPRKPQRDYYAIFKETLSVMATLTTLYLVLQQIAK
jgi:protein involved in polysaccharide export with SLBB domain